MSERGEGLAAAMRLMDRAKELGFVFARAGFGEDAPIIGERETDCWTDSIIINGFRGDCSATRVRKSSLTADGLPNIDQVFGNAVVVLRVACEWPCERGGAE
ncbi:MAG: hypothetical protein ACRDRX_04305 [Pseudonocardiaceae bacterium]